MLSLIFRKLMLSSETKISEKKSGRKSKPGTWIFVFDMLHMAMRFGISGSFFNYSDRHENQNQNELGNFSQETKETKKATEKRHPRATAIVAPGVVLIERILYSTSYVGRRGKPSTWLPRPKLAEQRILV